MPSRPSPPGSPSQPASKPAPPSICLDPTFALQPWQIQLVIGRRRILVDAHPASQWVAALIQEDLIGATLELFGEDIPTTLTEDLLDGAVTSKQITDAVLDTISLVSGRPWWFTLRLLHTAAQSWDTIGGYLAIKGIRADVMSLQMWCDALLHTILRHVSDEKHTSFLAQLKAPPPGSEVAEVIDEKREADAFMAYMRTG